LARALPWPADSAGPALFSFAPERRRGLLEVIIAHGARPRAAFAALRRQDLAAASGGRWFVAAAVGRCPPRAAQARAPCLCGLGRPVRDRGAGRVVVTAVRLSGHVLVVSCPGSVRVVSKIQGNPLVAQGEPNFDAAPPARYYDI